MVQGILLDTSVLIELLDRKRDIELPDNVYIFELSLFEYLRGKKKFLKEIKENLELAFNIIKLNNEVILKASEIYNKLKEKGKPISSIDCLIAAATLVYNLELWTYDKDYLLIKEIYPELRIRLLEK